MTDLREQIQQCFRSRVCLMGLGNTDYGDDGLGVRLAEILAEAGVPNVIIAGTTPDRFVCRVADEGFDHLIFFDAVEFGGVPGSVVFLNSKQMANRFPQISTHKVSLGMLAKWAESNGKTRAWLLGVQPESLKQAMLLTPKLQATLEMLTQLLAEAASAKLEKAGRPVHCAPGLDSDIRSPRDRAHETTRPGLTQSPIVNRQPTIPC
jgi:hydrogenase 3 maturation protease